MMHEAEMCGSEEACETCCSSKLLNKTGRGREGPERKLGVVGQQEVGIGLKIGRVDQPPRNPGTALSLSVNFPQWPLAALSRKIPLQPRKK